MSSASEGKHSDSKLHDAPVSPPRLPTTGHVEREDDNPALRPVRVNFLLPSGDSHAAEFKGGQTVEVLKSYLQTEFDIPMHDQALTLGGTVLIDPLSLNDYDGFRGGGVVDVTVSDRRGK
mmetsp:Transcript_6095/g.19417  ORF Transcript_6095/g.19417 Transcript_6095/m.19417 type:complete len:120 (+) Transcript_6095:1-360(+)